MNYNLPPNQKLEFVKQFDVVAQEKSENDFANKINLPEPENFGGIFFSTQSTAVASSATVSGVNYGNLQRTFIYIPHDGILPEVEMQLQYMSKITSLAQEEKPSR